MMKFTYTSAGGATYTTMDGDVLDLVAFNFYGTHDGTTALLYEANRDLALVDQPFSAGTVIQLPPRPQQPASPSQIQLWE